MKIIANEKSIKRNVKIGQYTVIASLVVLGGGMYISFSRPEFINYSLIALTIGFILSQIGMYFSNRWGRSPRIDEQLTASLKGLTKDYSLYHYIAPISHLLVGPAGVWILIPYHQRGKIYYDGKRWKQKSIGFLQSYLRVFGQESLGRPDLDAQSELNTLARALTKSIGEPLPKINVALVFLDKKIELDTNNAPLPTLKANELKEFIRIHAKKNPFSAEQIKRVVDVLPSS